MHVYEVCTVCVNVHGCVCCVWGVCNLYRVSETDNAPLESEILSGLCGGQENNRSWIPSVTWMLAHVVWVGVGCAGVV